MSIKKFAMSFLLAIVMCVGLQACGGADAQQTPAVAASAAGGSADAMTKAVTVERDTTSASGGGESFVNAAAYDHTVTGIYETALEWVRVVVLDNHSAKSAGNTALYAQANKWNTGATFAAVSEASDTTGLYGALVTHEFDNWTTGKDNGLRIGLEVLNGDSLFIRGVGKSDFAESTAALRIGQTVSTPWASWGTGIELNGNFRDHAFILKDPKTGATLFEIKPNGDIYRRGQLLP